MHEHAQNYYLFWSEVQKLEIQSRDLHYKIAAGRQRMAELEKKLKECLGSQYSERLIKLSGEKAILISSTGVKIKDLE